MEYLQNDTLAVCAGLFDIVEGLGRDRSTRGRRSGRRGGRGLDTLDDRHGRRHHVGGGLFAGRRHIHGLVLLVFLVVVVLVLLRLLLRLLIDVGGDPFDLGAVRIRCIFASKAPVF